MSFALTLGLLAALSLPAAETPKTLLDRSLTAIGGADRVRALKTLRLQGLGQTLLLEQSERPEGPYVINFETFTEWRDLGGRRLRRESTWHGSQFETPVEMKALSTPEGGSLAFSGRTLPARPAQLEDAEQALALGPERVLLAARAAADLHAEADERYLGKAQRVLAFHWNGLPVRLLLHPDTALPTAVEVRRPFQDFWFYWGDVDARICWGDWRRHDGLLYPHLWNEARNGQPWRGFALTDVQVNPALPEADFQLAPNLAAASSKALATKPRIAWTGSGAVELRPGLLFVPGPWNLALVKTDAGLILLEAPIGTEYIQGALAEATRRFPGQKVLAAVSTSDSWPHHGGLRTCAAEGFPIHALDANRPLLERILAAPWTQRPDALQAHPRKADWHWVSGRTKLGSGPNRMELIPLRGNATERQMMVYFPEHKLLYASDTLATQPDGSLYNPVLMEEVAAAVAREGLEVETVFAMHAGPTPWKQVLEALAR